VTQVTKNRAMEINYRTYKEKNWIDGLIEGCHFSAEVFDEGSKYGINNGRISRLNMVDKNGTLQIYYDRDWNVKPTGKIKAIYKQVVSFFETFPKGKRLDQHYKAQVIKS
jgi:hypothetical protein